MQFYFALPFLPGGGLEWIIVVMAALMIFGSELPQVALRGVAHVMRFRRAVAKMWHDTGLEDELRRVRRDIELSIPREADFDIKESPKNAIQSNDARAAAERAREAAERNSLMSLPGSPACPSEAGASEELVDEDPDAHRSGGFRIEPADGTVAAGDYVKDSVVRDQTPGTDRQEPTAHSEGSAAGSVEPDATTGEDDFGGSHFGAGVRKPS